MTISRDPTVIEMRAARQSAAPPASSCRGTRSRSDMVLALQRQAGNRAVGRLLGRHPARVLSRYAEVEPETEVEPEAEEEVGPQGRAHAPRPGSMEDFLQWTRDEAFRRTLEMAPPLATLDRGATGPPFITVEPPGPRLRSPASGDRVYELSVSSGKRLHVLDAIEYEVARAKTVQDLTRVLADYVGYVPGFGTSDPFAITVLTPVIPKVVLPPDFDPDDKRMTVFAQALAAKPKLAAALQAQKGLATTALLDPKSKPKPQKKAPPDVVLWLPSFKRRHLRLYQGLLGILQHDPANRRTVNAQSGKWDRGMDPNAPEGMDVRVYEEGLRLGIDPKRILRPNWSRDNPRTPMEVDHMVELQVLPKAQVDAWGDSFVNYELLDRLANGLSGGILQTNIRAERLRLMLETEDPTWATRVLKFTQVRVQPGPDGQRWLAEEIRSGDHLRTWRRQRGELPQGR